MKITINLNLKYSTNFKIYSLLHKYDICFITHREDFNCMKSVLFDSL